MIDASENSGIEQVHAVKENLDYAASNPDTFEVFPLSSLRELAEDEDFDQRGFSLLKVYCRDHRSKGESLLHNDLVNISLIDSPGLNIDTCKTTCLFTKQQEIDVVCFVVNAENHFTLSGKQFLERCALDKEWVFVIVNKFDLIKRKERCMKGIFDQLQSLSQGLFKLIKVHLTKKTGWSILLVRGKSFYLEKGR